MGLNKGGYVYTLIISMMAMIILSLMVFYSDISSPAYEDTTTKMSVNELHYYVESLKKDASRAVSISSQRAATYATDHVINTNETLQKYNMVNCTDFNYYATGSEAAIAELMVCGTLKNASVKSDATDIEKYMGNNTVRDWIQNVYNTQGGGPPYNVTIILHNMTFALYDSWHYMVLSDLDFVIEDTASNSRYTSYGNPIVSVIDISALEDPEQYVRSGIPSSVRTYTKCDEGTAVNGTVLDGWIDSGCYHSTGSSFRSPSYFDRLEGNSNLSAKFLQRASNILGGLNYTLGDIGLESMVNLELMKENNVSVNNNLTQVDYLYWSGQASRCSVDGMSEHPDFRLDVDHAVIYSVTGLDCSVDVGQNLGGFDTFDPSYMEVPSGTTITWVEKAGMAHTVHATSKVYETEGVLPQNSVLPWYFNISGEYVIQSTPATGNFGIFHLVVT